MGLAVAEEVVDEHADDGEEEDNECPDELVGDRTVRLEDLNPGNDVKSQDNETDNTSNTSLPWLRTLRCDGRCLDEHEQRELEEEGEDKVEHFGGLVEVLGAGR